MQANLVRSSGKRMKLKERMFLERFERVVFAYSFATFARMHDGHLLAVTRVPPDRRFHAARGGGRFAIHKCKIGLFHFSQTELVLQPAMGAFVFSEHDQTGSLLVQTVDNSRPFFTADPFNIRLVP